jgi:hypothetical protein
MAVARRRDTIASRHLRAQAWVCPSAVVVLTLVPDHRAGPVAPNLKADRWDVEAGSLGANPPRTYAKVQSRNEPMSQLRGCAKTALEVARSRITPGHMGTRRCQSNRTRTISRWPPPVQCCTSFTGRRTDFEVMPIRPTIAVQDYLSESRLRPIRPKRATAVPT